ncbi:MAG: hypothetical protein F4X11_06305 [Acidobacteria bacterium]|nr:hypothetical protein [Acidobacteriota bacterium]
MQTRSALRERAAAHLRERGIDVVDAPPVRFTSCWDTDEWLLERNRMLRDSDDSNGPKHAGRQRTVSQDRLRVRLRWCREEGRRDAATQRRRAPELVKGRLSAFWPEGRMRWQAWVREPGPWSARRRGTGAPPLAEVVWLRPQTARPAAQPADPGQRRQPLRGLTRVRGPDLQRPGLLMQADEPGTSIPCERYGSEESALAAIVRGRRAGEPGLPCRDDWPAWHAAEMRAAVEYRAGRRRSGRSGAWGR